MKSTTALVLILYLLSPIYLPVTVVPASCSSSVPLPFEDNTPEMTVLKSQPMKDSEIRLEAAIRRTYLMGTLCTIQIYSQDCITSLNRTESFILLLENAERELSTWQETSILSRLNRQPVGDPFELDPPVYHLFKVLQYWSEVTAYAFDPTIGRLLEAYGSEAGGRWPPPDLIGIAKANRGMNLYNFDEARRRITKVRDIKIDSGAFGKGEALDRILRADTANDAWLVDLGGQVLVHGLPPGKSGWQATIAHPRNRRKGFLTIHLKYGSLATSGGSERDVEVDNRRLGHIMNPDTGRPAEFNGSVSVWHEQALVADILSTALYVMGPVAGLSWAENQDIAACFLIPDEEGNVEILPTRAFTEHFLRK